VIVGALYDKLVDFEVVNGTLTPVPELAERWEISEDGKTYTFYLRKGIKFSSGNELTADDVVFTFKRYLLLEKPSAWLLAEIGINKDNMDEAIKKIDDYTVQFTFKPFSSNIILGILTNSFGGIVDKKEVLKHEVNGDLGEKWLTDHSAGSGPYVLVSWERNQHVILQANENYWKGAPRIKRIIFRDVPEATNQRLMLEKGDADIAWNLEPKDLEEMKSNPDIKIATFPGHGNRYIAVNCGWGPFKDPRVRLAIKYAINYDEIINDVMLGYAIKVQGLVLKGYQCYYPKNPFKQDIEKAKKLLAEAGYPDGFDVELLVGDSTLSRNQAVKIQSDLAKVGIRVHIVVAKGAQLYTKYRKQGHQMILAGWGSDYPDPDNYAKPFADYTVHQLAWRNMWYDDYASLLAKKGGIENDPVKRCQIYEDLTEYWFLNSPFAILYQNVNYFAYRSELKNFEEAFNGYSQRTPDFTKLYKE
ncbi:MAG: ABC transporter substrate-binding protein, partial [Thermotogae bacterium]|nr:ABC transporter substrate-binding protein [Thermotogota bacterium]